MVFEMCKWAYWQTSGLPYVVIQIMIYFANGNRYSAAKACEGFPSERKGEGEL